MALITRRNGEDIILPFFSNGNVPPDGSAGSAGQSMFDFIPAAAMPLALAAASGSHQILIGTRGDDTLAGGGGNDLVFGLSGNDHLSGASGHDLINGGGGGDIIYGGEGNDLLSGNGGADEISGDAISNLFQDPASYGNDVLFGGSGDDLLSGDTKLEIWTDTPFMILNPPEFDIGKPIPVGNYLLDGEVGGDDRLFGGAGDDILIGDAQSLGFDARGGDDELFGGAGNDRLFGDAYTGFFDRPLEGHGELFPDAGITQFAVGGDDILHGGAGDDELFGDALNFGTRPFVDPSAGIGGNDTLYGGSGNDTLFGDALGMFGEAMGGNDTLYGGSGNDTLYGGAQGYLEHTSTDGDDALYGGSGDDLLFGGSGNDLLDGGNDTDTAGFNGIAEGYAWTSLNGTVTVTDLASGDIDTAVNIEFLQFDDVTMDVSTIA